MNRNLLLFIIILVIIVTFAFVAFSNFRSTMSKKTVTIQGNSFIAEVADSAEEQRKGLSKRDSLAQDRGMIFIFDKPSIHTFWMKDMRFPLDIIFIQDNKIVTIHKNVQPELSEKNATNFMLYRSEEPADKVLEINAGLSDKYNIKVGDTITINN